MGASVMGGGENTTFDGYRTKGAYGTVKVALFRRAPGSKPQIAAVSRMQPDDDRLMSYAPQLWAVLLVGIFWLAIAMPSSAGVLVTENVKAGATSWLPTPMIQTVTNPVAQTQVGESFNAVGGCTNYAQTFTMGASNCTLQTVSLYAGGGTGIGSGTNLLLRLFDLGIAVAPNPSPYTAGVDLFNSGSGLAVNYSPQTTGILQFDFTGNDQVTLQSGHMYAFEIDGALNSSPIIWQRTTSDAYAGGAAYRNRSWINGTSGREFAMAVYASALGTTNLTNAAWIPQGIVFYAFSAPSDGVNSDGANPAAGFSLAGGVLCGTTLNGGAQGAGTAFYLTPKGTAVNSFRSFSDEPDAAGPRGELNFSAGQFFGTSFGGGNKGAGSIFVGQTNGSIVVLRSLAALNANTATNSGGASPGGAIAISSTTLYGAASTGGNAANGTVFSVTTNGSTFTELHDFSALDSQTGTNVDGAMPYGGLILSGGTLFGTASAGGAGGSGVIFSLGMNSGNFVVLHSFAPLDVLTATNADGAMPLGGLVLSNGMLYGTTYAGGFGGRGTVFALQTNGNGFTVLHHFGFTDSVTGVNADGASPCAALALAGDLLYGTTSAGGVGGAGTVFSVNTNGAQFATVHNFAAMASNGTNLDGAFPVAPVLLLNHSVYGTAFSGGPFGAGMVFSIPLPATITGTFANPDRSITLSFLGVPNSTNVVQFANNLTPPVIWQDISTNDADGAGTWQFTDTSATAAVRFYRSYLRQ
jgi:uncharacterized repeat protein (TIGR03803 family)